MKKRALVTGGSADQVAAIATFVINIKETNPNLVDEIVIFHDGIKKSDQKRIQSIFPTRFIYYTSPFKNTDKFGTVVTEYFSLMVFCKYECLKLLSEYSAILWSDYDVVVQDKLDDLFETTANSIKTMSIESVFYQLHNPVSEYNMDAPAMATGIFVFFDTLPYTEKLYSYCIEKTIQYAENLFCPEQAVFSFMIQEFGLSFDIIDNNIYVVHPKNTELAQQAKILHAYGHPKFWNGLHNDDWEKYYSQWLKLGGTKHPDRQTQLDRFINRNKMRFVKYIVNPILKRNTK